MRRIFVLFGVVAALSACSSTTKSEYDTAQTMLSGSPKVRSQVVTKCTAELSTKPARTRQGLADVANTSISSMPRVVCQRIVTAWANGKLTYADIQATERGVPTPNTVRIIQGRG